MNRKRKLMAVAFVAVMGSASIATGADTSFKPWYQSDVASTKDAIDASTVKVTLGANRHIPWFHSNNDKANSSRKDQVTVQAGGSSYMPWYQGGYAAEKAKSGAIKMASKRNASEG